MSRPLRIALLLLTACVLAALAAYGWRIWYVRYLTDDFCSASQVREMGYFAGLRYQRDVWSGRFSYFALKGLLELAGPWTARLTPAVILALIAIAAGWTLRRLLEPASRLIVFAAAAVLAFAVIDASPSRSNIGGTFFWETGAMTYALPMVLLTFWLGLLASRRSLGFCCTVSAALALVAGGLSETSLAAQGAMMGGVLLIALLLRGRREGWIAAAGVGGTLIALLIVAAAPGNAVRASAQAAPVAPGAALVRTFDFAYRYIGTYVFTGGAALLLVIVIGIVAGMYARRLSPRIALLAAAIAAGAYVVSFLPSAWLLPPGPPERALDIANYWLIVALFARSAACGRTMNRHNVLAAVIVLSCVIPIASIIETVRSIPEARQHAAGVDAMHRTLTARRGQAVTLRAPWALRARMLHDDPRFWTNQCVADYYGLQSLRITR